MAYLFLSHSSADRAEAEALRAWLRGLGHESVFLDVDPDPEGGLVAGEPWEARLYTELSRCRALVALVTPAWLDSPWCTAEASHAQARGRAIFELRVPGIGPALYARRAPPALKAPQRIAWNGSEEARARLRDGLAAAGLDPRDLFVLPAGRAPYPGLAAFEREDAAVFFGRDAEITQLQAELRLCRAPDRPRLLIVQGASGSGKSSLVRAGLLPRLERDQRSWALLPPFRPRRDPLRFLADALHAAAGGALPPAPPIEPPADPGTGEAWRAAWAGWVLDAASALRRRAGQVESTVLLVVDQLEEALDGAAAGDAFLRLLRDTLARSGPELLALATVRADFGGAVQRHPMLREPPASAGPDGQGDLLATRTMQLTPLPPKAIAEIVTRPAALVGLEIEQALVTRLVADTRTEDALPLLAFTLGELWKTSGESTLRLTVRDYEAFGGLEDAVGRRADAVLRALEPGPEELAAFRATLLYRLIDVSADGRAVRRPLPLRAVPAPAQRLVDAFADARLLVKGEDTTEVAHEALFRTWPVLAGWIAEARADLLLRRRAGEAAEAWDAAGRPEGSLWRSPDLDRLAEYAGRNPTTLPQVGEEFLARSQVAAEERKEQERRGIEEREAALRRAAEAAEARAAAEAKARADAEAARRRIRGWLGATALSATVAIAGAGFAVSQRRQAVIQRDAAEAVLARANEALARGIWSDLPRGQQADTRARSALWRLAFAPDDVKRVFIDQARDETDAETILGIWFEQVIRAARYGGSAPPNAARLTKHAIAALHNQLEHSPLPIHMAGLGHILAALAGQLDAGEMAKLAASVLNKVAERGASMLDASAAEQALWALVRWLGPDEASRAVASLLLRLNDKEGDPFLLASSGHILAALAGRLGPDDAARVTRDGVAALLARLRSRSADSLGNDNLGQALAALARRLSPDEAATVAADAAAVALEWLRAQERLRAEEAERETLDDDFLASLNLGPNLTALAQQLRSPDAAKLSEAVLEHLRRWGWERDAFEVASFGRVLAALAGRLEPDDAARVARQGTEVLLARLRARGADSSDLALAGEALAELAGRLGENEAATVAGEGAAIVLERLRAGRGGWSSLFSLGQALAALAGRLEKDEAVRVAGQGAAVVLERLRATDDASFDKNFAGLVGDLLAALSIQLGQSGPGEMTSLRSELLSLAWPALAWAGSPYDGAGWARVLAALLPRGPDRGALRSLNLALRAPMAGGPATEVLLDALRARDPRAPGPAAGLWPNIEWLATVHDDPAPLSRAVCPPPHWVQGAVCPSNF